MIANAFEIHFVEHGFPDLFALMTDEGQQDSFRKPNFKSERADGDEYGEIFCGGACLVIFDGVGMGEPEKRVGESQVFEAHVDGGAGEDEEQEKEEGHDQAAYEDEDRAIEHQEALSAFASERGGGKELVGHSICIR